MSRPLTLLALVWAPFLSIFVFASQGDTSALHIASHLLALGLLIPASLLAWRMRAEAPGRASRWILTILSASVPVAVLGHAGELAVAVLRLAEDGWVNLDTADIWEHGPHVTIAIRDDPGDDAEHAAHRRPGGSLAARSTLDAHDQPAEPPRNLSGRLVARPAAMVTPWRSTSTPLPVGSRISECASMKLCTPVRPKRWRSSMPRGR